jgi:hypothetical protein
VDLAGPFPPDQDGNRYLAVAVDVFTKWVEADPIPDKRAFTTAAWFYDAVVCRWGRPSFIRLDHGSEWEAEFRSQAQRLHLAVRQGTVGNSRANGQVERMIRTLKSVVRRYLGRQPTLFWSDVIPYALVALRMTPASAHGLPPFTVITGGIPVLPSQLPEDADELPGEDATPQEEADYMAAMARRIEEIRERTGASLSRRERLIQAALKRRDARGTTPETMFLFSAGDLVL